VELRGAVSELFPGIGQLYAAVRWVRRCHSGAWGNVKGSPGLWDMIDTDSYFRLWQSRQFSRGSSIGDCERVLLKTIFCHLHCVAEPRARHFAPLFDCNAMFEHEQFFLLFYSVRSAAVSTNPAAQLYLLRSRRRPEESLMFRY
jgi:hypothetical protein